MSELEHDKEFEAYLARHPGMRGRFAEPDNLEPPRELDRIVLAKAREAIETPRQLPLYAGARWALPVALAATLVLSFAIMLHLGVLSRPARDASTPVNAQITTATAPSVEVETASRAERANSISIDEPRNQPGPALMKSERSKKVRVPQATADLAAVRAVPVPAAPPADTAVTVTGERKPDAMAAMPSAVSAEADKFATKAPGAAEWIKRIEQLRAQGKLTDAERELREFRKTWPDYPLPEPLDR